MKIVVFGDGHRVGALEGAKVIDLANALTEALRDQGRSNSERAAAEQLGVDLEGFIVKGSQAIDSAEEALNYVRMNGANDQVAVDVGATTIHAPWPRRRIACAGGNYADHLAGMQGGADLEAVRQNARDQGQWGFWKVPDEPSGPSADIPYPQRTEYLDYEGEVAIILGKRGKDIAADKINDFVWGITLVNDVSIRDGVSRPIGMSYNLAKNFDGSVVIGPVIVVNEGLDPQNVDAQTHVNGQLRQSFNSKDMIFSFGEVLEHLSRDMTFVPGDIISGGTAQGTAADKTPRVESGDRAKDLFLKVGDVVEVSSDSVGVLKNKII